MWRPLCGGLFTLMRATCWLAASLLLLLYVWLAFVVPAGQPGIANRARQVAVAEMALLDMKVLNRPLYGARTIAEVVDPACVSILGRLAQRELSECTSNCVPTVPPLPCPADGPPAPG